MYEYNQKLAVRLPGASKLKLMLFHEQAFDGFWFLKDVDNMAGAPMLVSASDARPWKCDRFGHNVRFWTASQEDAGDQPVPSGREVGTCDACDQTISRAETLDHTLLCGNCEGTLYVQSAHERAAKIKGTVPCPVCFEINNDV